MNKSSALPLVPGKVQSHHLHPTGISGIAENARFEIQVFRETTFRVRVTNRSEWQENPYSVVADPQENCFEFEEDKEFLVLKTSKLQLWIRKKNLSMVFKTPAGQVINEDDPDFGINWLGTEVSSYKLLQEWEKFIGLGEKNGGLNRYGQSYTHWNTDHFAYDTDDDPLYCSIPFYMGLHHGIAYGIFFDNTHKTTFNFGAGNNRYAYFAAEDGDLDYYFFHDVSVTSILLAYTALTGPPPLPPRWALGYQQCRYSYYPEKEVLRLAQTFRDKAIPGDVIYLDIHHMSRFKVFTFDKETFPNPAGMIRQLKELGFRVVVILDPGIKADEDYEPYIEGSAKGLFVCYPNGKPYQGQVWPGWCTFPDFTLPKARSWWAAALAFYTELGVDGFWTDMNEPATWGQTVPNLVQFDYEGKGASHRKARNVYGMQMARSTREGQETQRAGVRPFVLTRAGFAGVQRYAALWTGDNVSSDAHMMAGVRLVNSLGLSGVPFSGYDIGGFVGNCTPELFARWISIAAFCPLFRAHTMINSHASEPWSFGEEVEAIARNYIRLRYKLMPAIYAAFYASHKSGLPVAKSLALAYPFDDRVYHGAYDSQYLFCEHLLIVPVESQQTITKLYLPEGDWYHLFTGEKRTGPAEIFWECPLNYLPVFVAAGAILPMQSATQHASDAHDGRIKLHVFKGSGTRQQLIYEDDGNSHAYQKGEWSMRSIQMDHDHGLLEIGALQGNFPSSYTQAKIYFHGFPDQVVEVGGRRVKMDVGNIAFLDEIAEYDPLPMGDHPFQLCASVPNLTLDLDASPQTVQLKGIA
jgi:alpha-glucosidase